MATYRGSDGRSYKLGTVISKGGGEGQIHEVSTQPNVVAKIWNKPSIQRARKLDALLRHGPKIRPALRPVLGLAWPSIALSDKRGTTVGFLMRKVPPDRYHDLVNYCIPNRRRDLEASRGSAFSRTDLTTIALNVALLFAHLHRSGYVIGDVNHSNILAAADGRVFLIDVDSIQTADPDTGEVYRCTVGKDDFTPPRLVGRRFDEVDRVVEDDLFGLAVLTFQILMDGCHPYDAVDQSGKQGHTRAENIRTSNSPFARLNLDQARAYVDLDTITNTKLKEQKKAKFLASIEGNATADFATLIVPRVALWLDLEPRFRDLFTRAFGNGAGVRPTALEWVLTLNEAGARKPATSTTSRLTSPPSRTVKKPGNRSARKTAMRSASSHSLSTRPIKSQVSSLSRSATKAGKRKSRKKSAKRSSSFTPSPRTPFAATHMRSANPHSLSTRPRAIVRGRPIKPQVNSLSRSATKAGKRKSRKKSANRSSSFTPPPRTPFAATQESAELNWMAVGLMAVLTAGGFLFLCRDEISQLSEPSHAQYNISQLSEPAVAQSDTPCGSLQQWADLRRCDLSGKDLRGVNLTGVDLRHSDLTSTNLEGAVLDSANLANANLTRSNLKSATLMGATLSGATIEGTDMTDVELIFTDISDIKSFDKATLRNVTFPAEADLGGVSFVEADLSGSSITGANLKGADFTKAKLCRTDFSRTVLKRATFERAEIQDAYFFDASLSRASMTGANAHGAFFIGSNVSDVDFRGSDLSNASFRDADVRGANFSNADLTNAYFGSSTNVSKAIFGSTVCSDGVENDNCFFEGRLSGIQP